MATSGKLSFRARTLDANKPMVIYFANELPDLSEATSINRAVPQMPTGMEKEEEMVGSNMAVRAPALSIGAPSLVPRDSLFDR